MAKIPTIDKIEYSLSNFDNEILTKQIISNLLRGNKIKKLNIKIIKNKNNIFYFILEYITDEEIKEYENLVSLPGDFEKQEDILIKIKNIEFSKEKLSIWNFIHELDDHIDSLEVTVESLKNSFEQIRKNLQIKKLLTYILSIGNILNGGTNKGQADGFSLDILGKLTSMKDNTNKTILQLICIKIKTENEDFGPLKKQFECLEEALKIPISEIRQTIEKYVNTTKINLNLLDKISLSDNFTEKAKKKLDFFLEKISKLDQKFKKIFIYGQETILFFGYSANDAKYKKPDEFLSLFNEFINDIDKSIPMTEAKKAFKGTKEMGKKITDNKNNNSMDALINGLKMKMTG